MNDISSEVSVISGPNIIKAGIVMVFPMRKCGTRSMVYCWGESD